MHIIPFSDTQWVLANLYFLLSKFELSDNQDLKLLNEIGLP